MKKMPHAILPNNENWFRRVPCMLFLKDLNSAYIDSTNYFARLYGYENADAINGTTDFEARCKAAEFADAFIAEDKKVILTKSKLTVLYMLSYTAGTKTFIANKSPLYDNADNIIGVACQATEISKPVFLRICGQLRASYKKQGMGNRKQLSHILNTAYDNINLSKRESECLFYLLRGKSYRAIGEILNLSPRTIETHIDHIKNKMGCLNKAGVIEKAVAQGYMNVIPQGVFNQNLAFSLDI